MAAKRKKAPARRSTSRPPSRRKRAKKSTRRSFPKLKVAFLLLLLSVLVGGGVWVYYYTKFARLIEARLKVHPERVTAIYSRPLQVRKGQSLTLAQLTHRLDRAGYRRSSGPGVGKWYVAGDASLRIGQWREGRSEELRLSFSGGQDSSRVSSIQSRGRETDTAHLSGQFLSNFYNRSREKKKHVSYHELPEDLVEAVLAAEDEDFFEHPGLDITGLARALLVNVSRGSAAQGGSTLTQQFVKNYFLTQEKTFNRKFEEMFMAILLENRFSKKEILGLYANDVYLGQANSFAIHGLGQGAAVFFDKNASDLSLSEAALLAGVIQSPNRFSPRSNPERAKGRRNHILSLMERKGFISAARAQAARDEPLRVVPRDSAGSSAAPYFIDLVRREFERTLEFDPEEPIESLEIVTTLDTVLQAAAEEAVESVLTGIVSRSKAVKSPSEVQAAVVVLDPRNGDILAMTGGRHYSSSQFNRATRALRQPGSTFKPFIYAAALEPPQRSKPRYTLSTWLIDRPYTFVFDGRRYSPGNHSGRYRGIVSLRNALALSLNVPTVKLAEEIGFDSVTEFCREFGFERALKPYPSIALGTFELSLLELARAYTVFANEGRLSETRLVTEVRRDGLRTRFEPAAPRRVISPESAYLVNSALASVLSYGTARSVRRQGFDMPAAGKTGSNNDAWFVGYTPDLLCAVWVGYDASRPMGLEGSQAALPIWTRFMMQAGKTGRLSGRPLTRPPGIRKLRIDRQSGLRASSKCRDTYEESYVLGTEPKEICRSHRPVDYSD